MPGEVVSFFFVVSAKGYLDSRWSGAAPLDGSYNPWIVLLSVAVAILAAYAALTVVDRIRSARRVPLVRWLWLVAGATSMGTGMPRPAPRA